MIPALFLALLVQAPGAPSGARWRCEPPSVELGEPFQLVLELHGPLAARASLPDELDLGDSWIVLEPRRALAPADLERRELSWTFASLEPGERSLAETLQGLALFPAETAVELAAARVSVRGLLAEGEDQPRPLVEFASGFGAAPAKGSSTLLVVLLAALAFAVALVVVALVRARRRRRVAPAGPPSALERLGALASAAGDSARMAEGHYELTRLLRAATDGARAKKRDGLTDDEWLAELRASLEVPRSGVEELEAVFADAAAVKYAGVRPSSWAVQETLARARRALETVAGGAR